MLPSGHWHLCQINLLYLHLDFFGFHSTQFNFNCSLGGPSGFIALDWCVLYWIRLVDTCLRAQWKSENAVVSPCLLLFMNERPISRASVRAKNDLQVELESFFVWCVSVCLFCKHLDYHLFPFLVFNCFCIAGICGEIRKLNSLVFFCEDRQVACRPNVLSGSNWNVWNSCGH